MTMIDIPSGALACYVVEPTSRPPWPGVVVVHDALGMSNDLRDQARWLAGAGYLAAAPDLFGRTNRAICLASVMAQLRTGKGRAFDEIDATRRWLQAHERCTGRVGVVGFCLGGGLVLAMAPGHGFAASSVNYGAGPKRTFSSEFLRGACPIVGSFAREDPSLPGAAERLEGALNELGIVHDIKEYPDVGHGFMNNHEALGDKIPPLMEFAARFTPNLGYRESEALDARRRIIKFFEAHLRQ